VNSDLRVGLDIGATKVLGAVMDADGTVVAQSRQDTLRGADGILTTATTVIELLAAALDGALPPHIGIGIPGIVDRDRGAVSHAVNLGLGGDWFPLADRLADRTGATVVVENDVRAATWGAHVLSGADDLAYLSLGTGLAAGFVLSGTLRPRRGRRDRAHAGGPGGTALPVRTTRLPGAERLRLRPVRRLARRGDGVPGRDPLRRGRRGKPRSGRGP
jgi:predicted NBD/HSP70 family sugar kinase